MSGKDLFEGMSYVEERFVHEAEHGTVPRRNVVLWMKWASLAACLCLILLSAYNLYDLAGPGTNIGTISGDTPGGAVPVGTIPAAGGQSGIDMQPPAQAPMSEAPSVVLQVDDITESGFVGTVAQLVDTDIFEVGMELNVVVAEGIVNGAYQIIGSATSYRPGSYVMVQFIEYDRENGTIVINLIDTVEQPEKGAEP